MVRGYEVSEIRSPITAAITSLSSRLSWVNEAKVIIKRNGGVSLLSLVSQRKVKS